MRLSKADFRQRINGNCRFEFSSESITSYSGLELFRQYFRNIDFGSRLRRAFAGHRFFGDYEIGDHLRTLIALLITGGRKLDHLRFIASDPVVKRFCGLLSIPCDRSVSRWLKQFRDGSLRCLRALNRDLVLDQLAALGFSRVTLDLDGTVISCGDQVGWAARGYNPHKRYAKSYYPLLCHVGQTGHMLRVHNRPGNVHDSKGGALRILQQSVGEVASALGRSVALEVRLDSAFFTKEIVGYLIRKKIEFAIKAPMWTKTGFKQLVQERQRWHRAGKGLWYFTKAVRLNKWDVDVDLTFYRRKISDHPPKGYQYDLFSPDDGVYEYFILASNKPVHAKTLVEFYNGRCAMEAQIAELKGEFAFDTVPTNHYQANSAFQHISVLAYNLIRNFQIDTGLATTRKRSRKRTALFSFLSLKTLRFKMVAIAGRLIKREYGNVLRINRNPAVKKLYTKIEINFPYQKAA